MPLGQLAPGAVSALVIGFEQIDDKDGPRCDIGVCVERPDSVVDGVDEHIGSVGILIEGVALDKTIEPRRGEIQLEQVAADEVDVVVGGRTYTATNRSLLIAQALERRGVTVERAPLGAGGEPVDQLDESVFGEPMLRS